MCRLRKYRLAIIAAAALGALVCIVLLLNVTAPNPTRRRYSSQPVVMEHVSPHVVGSSAESVLAADLRLPNNNTEDQRQCFCSSSGQAPKSLCRSCVVSIPEISSFCVPDFIATSFVADSKNERLFPSRHDAEQIPEMAAGAKALGVPLWVYVRVCTEMKPEAAGLIEIIASTGGGLVPYFIGEGCPNYVDPVDRAAGVGLLVSLAVVAVFSVWEYRTLRPSRIVSVPSPAPRPRPGRNPFDKADTAADFMNRQRERARREIDIADAHDELD